MAENHVIVAGYAAGGYTKTRPAFQYDYGQELQLQGFPEGMLPASFEMHFSIGMGQAITRIGTNGAVAVPNACLERFGTLTAWLFLHDAETDGETRYVIEIPVRSRAKTTDQEPTPAEQSVITEAIAALNAGVNAAEAAQGAAETAQGKAEEAQGAAETAQGKAEEAQGAAEAAANSVRNAAATAETLAPGSDATVTVRDVSGVKTFEFGIPAGIQGETGNGIQSAVLNNDYTLTITYTDGTSYTTPSIRGATGNGIQGAVLNNDYTLTITYTDGTSYTTPSIRGAKGDTGATPAMSIGTVTTGAAGSSAAATMTGTPEAPVLNLTIPRGDPGNATIDDTAGEGDTTKVWSADKNDKANKSLLSAITNTGIAFEEGWNELIWRKDAEKGISYSDGSEVTSSAFAHTDYIFVAPYGKIRYMRVASTGSVTTGMAFYDKNFDYVNGKVGLGHQSSNNPQQDEIDVPDGAIYARFTYRKDTVTYGDFSISGAGVIYHEIDEFKTDINTEFQDELGTVLCEGWVDGKYIPTSEETVDITNPESNSNFSYIVIPCTSGDIFKIDVSGSSVSWPYVFVNANGAKLNEQPSNDRYGVTITAPTNSVYLVCNTKNNHKKVYKGASRITEIETNGIQNTTDIEIIHDNLAQMVVDTMPVMTENDFKIGTIDKQSGDEAGSIYAILTKSYYVVRGCLIDFTGAMDENRYCYLFYYDKKFTYISYDIGNVYTVPANAVYARIVYGFTSGSGYTVEGYGFANLVNDFSLVLKNINIDSIDASLSLIANGEMQLGFEFADGRYIKYATGDLASNSLFHATGYIAIPKGTEQIETNIHNTESGDDGYCFYDASYAPVSASGGKCRKSDPTIISVPNAAKFIRLSGRKSYEETGINRYVKAISGTQKKSNDEYTVVMIGDSIIGNYNGADSVPTYLEQISGAKCYNCAFGGSSMGTDTYGSVNELLLPFRGFKVIESIVNNDYTDMDNAIEADPQYEELKDYYPEHVALLKNMDWTKVDLLTISYGVNDWLLAVTLDDNPSNPKDTNTFGGAFRTALETLWATYPHIKVMVCSPIWCGGTISGGELAWDTDNHQNGIEKYLIQYVEKEAQIADEYHVPFLEMYNNTTFNRYTWKKYFPTTGSNAIHPNATGRYVIARRYAWLLAQY